MLLLFTLLSAAISNGLWVSAYTSITIGQNITILANETASTPVWHTDPPEPHPSYKITNIGKTTVWASIYYKDSWLLQSDDIFCQDNCSSDASVNVWFNVSEPVYIEPLESTFLSAPTNAIFYFTKLVVVSSPKREDQNGEAVVRVEYGNGEASLDDSHRIKRKTRNDDRGAFSKLNSTQIVKKVFEWGGSKIPAYFVKTGIDALIELFWPEKKPSVWDEIMEKVRYLIDQETLYTINTLLTRLMVFKRRLMQVASEVKEGQSDVSVHYMNVAQDFIGLEESISTLSHHNAKKLNEDLLPMYSNIILMKAAFYSLGMKCHGRIGLTQNNITNVKAFYTNMIRAPTDGANQYISQIFRNQRPIDKFLNLEYNMVMYTRNEIKKHGYVPIWNNMLDKPNQKLIIAKIFYSDMVGAYDIDNNVFPPLDDPLTSAGLSNGKYNYLQKLITYHSSDSCTTCCADAVVGMKIIFRNGAVSDFGVTSLVQKVIELNDTYRIGKIYASTNDSGIYYSLANFRLSLLKLDGYEWKNSVYNEVIFGCPSLNPFGKYIFEKENYYIASIDMVFDLPPRRFPTDVYSMLRMGVSFLPLESQLDSTIDEKDWKDWTC